MLFQLISVHFISYKPICWNKIQILYFCTEILRMNLMKWIITHLTFPLLGSFISLYLIIISKNESDTLFRTANFRPIFLSLSYIKISVVPIQQSFLIIVYFLKVTNDFAIILK